MYNQKNGDKIRTVTHPTLSAVFFATLVKNSPPSYIRKKTHSNTTANKTNHIELVFVTFTKSSRGWGGGSGGGGGGGLCVRTK